MTTLGQALAQGAARLAEEGVDGAARDAQILLAHATGRARMRLSLDRAAKLSADEIRTFEEALARRAAREPVSRIIGTRAFWGREFRVSPDVLDPRPETETLVAQALGQPAQRILDLGTGSGILAITLLAEWPGAEGVATDLSPAALSVAADNAARHSVQDRLSFQRADWFDGVDGTFDLIVSNPPYIAAGEMAGLAPEVRDHDPLQALTPGGDGLDAYRAIAQGAPTRLAPGGRILVEIGPAQARAVAELFADAGLDIRAVHPDLDGRDRVVSAVLPSP